MKVFAVICHDRHCDDAITVHSTRAGADQQIEDFKSLYDPEEYTFVERDYGRNQGWVRCVDTFDDGPNARIEETELLP